MGTRHRGLTDRDDLVQLRLDGGGGSGVSTVDFPSGMDTVELSLPQPRGTVPVQVGGGVNRFTVHAPAAVPVQVQAGGGAGSVTVDGQVHTGVGGGTVFAPSTWDSTSDRYDLDATAGVATIVVDRR